VESKIHTFKVKEADIAKFNEDVVHRVCSTFTLAREIEFATRQHIFNYLGENEEGIGSMLKIQHISPALVGELVEIQSEVLSFNNGDLLCSYTAKVNQRIVAMGETGQKVINMEKLKEIFSTLGDGK